MSFKNIKYKNQLEQFDLQYFMALQGELFSKDSISEVVKTKFQDHDIFIKRYFKPGKNLYRRLSKYTSLALSKGSSEFGNLLYFANNNFLTPEIIYFDEQNGQSCLVTKAVVGSQDLFKLYSSCKPVKSSKSYNFEYLIKYAELLARLHTMDFIHRDYKLRNVLLNSEGKLYLIDCPNGYRNILKFNLNKHKFRDLAIVYNDLKKLLSRTQMLHLYKHYFGVTSQRLTKVHKGNIKYILNYY